MESLKLDEKDKCLETFIENVLRNNLLTLIGELFTYILQETESTSECADLKPVLPSDVKNVGAAIKQILKVASSDIDQLFEEIKEKIQVEENLKLFISRLGHNFLGVSSQHELYYLTVTSRIYALMIKAEITSSQVFIEEVVDTLLESLLKSLYELALTRSLPTLNIQSSIADILKNTNWGEECEKMECGEASDYFSS